jgi:hypothetical protein
VSGEAALLAAFEGAVDRGAADSEQVGELGGAVLTSGHQADQVGFLTRVELGLFPAQPTLGPRHPHPLLRPQPDEVHRAAQAEAAASSRSRSQESITAVTIGVSMVPRHIALIRMPRGAYSRAALRVKPMTPCLEAW